MVVIWSLLVLKIVFNSNEIELYIHFILVSSLYSLILPSVTCKEDINAKLMIQNVALHATTSRRYGHPSLIADQSFSINRWSIVFSTDDRLQNWTDAQHYLFISQFLYMEDIGHAIMLFSVHLFRRWSTKLTGMEMER